MKKVGLILLFGIALSFAAFTVVKQWEEDKRQAEYNHRAEAHSAALMAAFRGIEKQLEDMRFLLEYDINNEQDNPRTPHEFMDMLTPVLTHEPALIDVDWAILGDTPKQAKIIYSWKHKEEPEKESSVPLNHQTITAQIVKVPHNHNHILQLITPISNQLNPISNQEIKGKVIAALVSEWDIGTIIEEALKHTPVSAQDIRISSVDNNKKTELYFHPSRSRTEADKDVHTNIDYKSSFHIANLTIEAEYEAAPKFLKDFPIVLAWQTLFILLAATFLLAWYIYKKDKYTEHVERLVEKRTQKLNKKRKKLRKIIENLQDIYYQMDLEGNIQMISPSIGSLGYTVDEVLTKNMQAFCMDSDELKNLLLELHDSADGKIHNHHIRVRHHNGSLRWLSMNAQYRYDENQKIVSIEGTLRDFTKVKENQEKLQQSDKLELLGLMAGSIAHNFNNILTAILGHASMARMEIQGASKLSKHMDAIEDSSTKAAEICKQMLAYTGQGNYCIRAIHLSESLEKIEAMMHASIPPHIKLAFNFEHDLPNIRADKSQIQQLAIDLILNAAESYEETKGTVHIETGLQNLATQDLETCFECEYAKPGEFIYLRVQDSGCGIAKSMQKEMFEPFVTSKFMGRGLGLSAVRGIVRAQHGAISLESEEGKGTTITVFFPIDKQDT